VDPAFAGYDLVMQAMTGLMSVTGTRGGPPTKIGVALLDVVAGLYAATGVLAALHERDATGAGRRVDVSLFEAGVAAMVNQAANHLLGGEVPAPMGSEHPNIAPYQVVEASDRAFVLAAGNDRLFARTCEVLGRPELAADPRFRANADRVRNREALAAALREALAERTAAEWLRALGEAGVPAAPIRSLDEVVASPEGAAIVERVDDPVRGPLRLVGSPIRLSGEDRAPARPPPRLGEHTEEVLRELGEAP
jgi:crotonobetainyl-CoA:carnitine CoA-transferase CaiB-like acyl-CoA transferase